MKTLKLLFFSLCLCTYIIEGSPISSPPILEGRLLHYIFKLNNNFKLIINYKLDVTKINSDNPVRIRVYAFCDMTIPIGIGTPGIFISFKLEKNGQFFSSMVQSES